MNYRFIASTVGKALLITAACLVAPLLVGVIYRETSWIGYLIAGVLMAATGFALKRFENAEQRGGIRDGFLIVSFCWILISAFGALPFVINGSIPSFVDALFETVSGLTTTGASVIPDIGLVGKADLFWRSFTHWLGGMGVLVLLLIFHPGNKGSLHLLRAEAPGPTVSKLVPKLGDTARTLYSIYLALSAIILAALLIAGAPVFDALILTFGTAGTGGYAIYPDGLASYNIAVQWVVAIGMVLFGINMSIFYLVTVRRVREILRQEEMRVYLMIVLTATVLIAANIAGISHSIGVAIKDAAFQVGSIISTTGFATTDFNLWPTFSKMILVILMFTGASAGSTAGGLKIARVVMLYKMVRNRIIRLVRPNQVTVVKLDGKRIDDEQITAVGSYFAAYVMIMVLSSLLLSLEGFDYETTTTAVIACFNNIGPGLGLVGPMGSYAIFSDWGKLLLSLNMLLGRLEIYPLLVVFMHRGWRR